MGYVEIVHVYQTNAPVVVTVLGCVDGIVPMRVTWTCGGVLCCGVMSCLLNSSWRSVELQSFVRSTLG